MPSSAVQLQAGHVDGPGVRPKDFDLGKQAGGLQVARVIPDEVAVGTGTGPDAHREHLDLEGREHGALGAHLLGDGDLVAQPLPRVRGRPLAHVVEGREVVGCLLRVGPRVRRWRLRRADADNGLEGRVVQDRHVRVEDLPKGLVGLVEGAYGDIVKGLQRRGVAAAVALPGSQSACGVALAQRCVVLGSLAARLAHRREDDQLEGARVQDARDRLAADGDVGDVLDVSEVDHGLTVAFVVSEGHPGHLHLLLCHRRLGAAWQRRRLRRQLHLHLALPPVGVPVAYPLEVPNLCLWLDVQVVAEARNALEGHRLAVQSSLQVDLELLRPAPGRLLEADLLLAIRLPEGRVLCVVALFVSCQRPPQGRLLRLRVRRHLHPRLKEAVRICSAVQRPRRLAAPSGVLRTVPLGNSGHLRKAGERCSPRGDRPQGPSSPSSVRATAGAPQRPRPAVSGTGGRQGRPAGAGAGGGGLGSAP
mmetsp:Transcript_27566/g.79189  ORF Transcript_27566/g.79189 Transcript_27566/m.79189 type:complete len:476 (+) Transcript_27566:1051-2478(+)